MEKKAIIIGGGIAGMSCADELIRAGEDFIIISDRLGGRIVYDEDRNVNYGAYFTMQNYENARKVVAAGRLVNPLDACFHNSEADKFSTVSLHTVRRLPGFVRFLLMMIKFKKHYSAYKENCLIMTQKQALGRDEYISGLFNMPAKAFLDKHKVSLVVEDYISKFAYACTGIDYLHVNALDFMNVSQGLFQPIHHIIFSEAGKEKEYGTRFIKTTVTGVEKADGGYLVSTESGEVFKARNLVVTTPAAVTKELLGLSEIRRSCSLYVNHVNAELKPNFRKRSLNLFPYRSEIVLTAKQWDGTYHIYSRTPDADLNIVCDSFTHIRRYEWEKAMYVDGSAYMEQVLGDGLYTAGDHNGLGLEPSAISGIFAAREIIKRG